MGREFQNIDQLAKEALSSLNEKAPSHVRANLNNGLRSNFGRGGFSLLALLILAGSAALFFFENTPSTGSEKSIVNNTYLLNGNYPAKNLRVTNLSSTKNATYKTEVKENSVSQSELKSQLTKKSSPLVENNENFDTASVSEVITNNEASESIVVSSDKVLKSKLAISQRPNFTGSKISTDKNNEKEEVLVKEDQRSKIDDSNIDVFGLNYPEVQISEPSQKKNSWFVAVETGINFTKTFYNSGSSLQEQVYEKGIEAKFSSETLLDINYRTKSALTLNGGVGLSQFNESYRFDITPETTFIGENKSNYAQIHLGLGTQINIKKFKLDLFAKGRFNKLISGSGAYLDGENLVNYSKSDDILTSSFFNLALGTRVHYPIYKNFHLNATVRYTPVFGELIQGTPITKKMQYTHAGVGVSYMF